MGIAKESASLMSRCFNGKKYSRDGVSPMQPGGPERAACVRPSYLKSYYITLASVWVVFVTCASPQEGVANIFPTISCCVGPEIELR